MFPVAPPEEAQGKSGNSFLVKGKGIDTLYRAIENIDRSVF